MNGFEDVAALDFWGLTVYVYGLYVSLGCLLAGGLLLFLCRGEEKVRNFAALSALFSPVLGLAAARLLWALTEVNFSPFLSIQNILNLRSGGFAMFGALIGAMLAARLRQSWPAFPLARRWTGSLPRCSSLWRWRGSAKGIPPWASAGRWSPACWITPFSPSVTDTTPTCEPTCWKPPRLSSSAG